MTWKTFRNGSATLPAHERWSEARETRRQIGRFLIVGATSVAVDLAAYQLLGSGLGMRLDAAKAASYLAGVVVGFVGNKAWTFQSSLKTWREPLSYLALYAVTMLVNVGGNRAALGVLGPEAIIAAFLFATGVTTVLNFLGMKFVTFRRGVQQRRQAAQTAPPGGTGGVWRRAA